MDNFFSVFFASGHVANLILVVMLIEGLALTIIAKKSKRGTGGMRTSRIIMSLAAGAALVLALRAALTGAGWQWMALALTAAFIVHLIDLYWRWTDER